MTRIGACLLIGVLAAAVAAGAASAGTLEVGPGKRFARIEEANAAAAPGDLILVYGSLTSHNAKSRARHTRVEYCYIRHSANRQLDLVDDVDTERPNSHAVIMGCAGNTAIPPTRSSGHWRSC
jgi:hypothetical protein